MASLTSGSGIGPLRRRSSSTTVDIPFADSDTQDVVLGEILEEQEEHNSKTALKSH